MALPPRRCRSLMRRAGLGTNRRRLPLPALPGSGRAAGGDHRLRSSSDQRRLQRDCYRPRCRRHSRRFGRPILLRFVGCGSKRVAGSGKQVLPVGSRLHFFLLPCRFSTYTPPRVQTSNGFASFIQDEFDAVRRAPSLSGTSPREVQMLICDLLKNQVIISAKAHQTVLEVAIIMLQHNIATSQVVQEGRLAGIFSERDLMSRVVVCCKDPAHTMVSQVMTEDPLTVAPNDPLETCMTLMKRHGFRHLPVCAGRELKGVVSLRDILLHDLDEKDDEVRMMRAYLHSTPDAG